jgi:flavin reductase (DIM6/NTAB) family NADH-FMN oxidoreductase RutF
MSANHQDFVLLGEEALKAVFRNHASGIAILTARTDAGVPIGFTASSVTSLGSNPPLVSVNISQGSSSYRHLSVGAKLALHTLDEQTLHLAKRLAGPRDERFDGTEVEGPYSLPLFEDAPAILIGEISHRFEVEQNAVLVISVLRSSTSRVPSAPLVYFQRAWHTICRKLADQD